MMTYNKSRENERRFNQRVEREIILSELKTFLIDRHKHRKYDLSRKAKKKYYKIYRNILTPYKEKWMDYHGRWKVDRGYQVPENYNQIILNEINKLLEREEKP